MARFTCNFLSYTLKRAVNITVVIPSVSLPETGEAPSHDKGALYPVLYLLHGYGNNHETWTSYTRAEMFAEENSIALVMPSNDNQCYLDHGGDNNGYSFILNELPEFVKAMFPVSRRPEDTYIAGLSMGGYGALRIGLENSRRYGAIGAFSAPSMLNVPGAPDVLKTAEKCALEDRRIPLFIACGEEDGLLPFTKEAAARCRELGFAVTEETVPGYGHEWRFWERELEGFLEQLPRKDAVYIDRKGEKRRV